MACLVCLLGDVEPAEATPQRLGHYEIESLLGQGGMARVYTARDTRSGARVALKLLPLDPVGDGRNLVERFRREARALARLRHAHIVALHGFGQDGAHAWIAMELVEGHSLAQEIPATPERARAIATQICDALAYAHARGVIHRDLKPGNVLIDHEGRVKVADFGIAAALPGTSDDTRVTLEGVAIGTPAYMAPEALAGAAVSDPRLDVYSFGVLFYELLTGHLPVGLVELPGTPFDHVIARALQHDPAQRYASIEALRRDLLPGTLGTPAPELPPFDRLLWAGTALLLALGTELLLQVAHRLSAPTAESAARTLFGVIAAVLGSVAAALLLRRWRALGYVELPAPADERGLSIRSEADGFDAPPWPAVLVIGAALCALGAGLPVVGLRALSTIAALFALFGFWADVLDAQRRVSRPFTLRREGALFVGLGLVVASRLLFTA